MLTPHILSGGSGTRLWPLSRDSQPTQFLALTGPHTMPHETARRLSGFDADASVCIRTIAICSDEHCPSLAKK